MDRRIEKREQNDDLTKMHRWISRAVSCGFPGELWSIILGYLFCADSRAIRGSLLSARHLDERHIRTHSWRSLNAPTVAPTRIFSDTKCLGRVALEFAPVCRDRCSYWVELEDESDPLRPVENPTTVSFECTLPIDGFCRQIDVELNSIFRGPIGTALVRVRQHDWSETIHRYWYPNGIVDRTPTREAILRISHDNGVPLKTIPSKSSGYWKGRYMLPRRTSPHLYVAGIWVKRHKSIQDRRLSASILTVTVTLDTFDTFA